MKLVHKRLDGLEPKWNTSWDYLGYKKYIDKDIAISQRDWIQTLIRRISEISAQMHMSTLLDPANTVITSPGCAALIESFEYFDHENNKIGERFDFIVDNELKEDAVYVYGLSKIDECPEDKLNYLIGKIEIKNYE